MHVCKRQREIALQTGSRTQDPPQPSASPDHGQVWWAYSGKSSGLNWEPSQVLHFPAVLPLPQESIIRLCTRKTNECWQVVRVWGVPTFLPSFLPFIHPSILPPSCPPSLPSFFLLFIISQRVYVLQRERERKSKHPFWGRSCCNPFLSVSPLGILNTRAHAFHVFLKPRGPGLAQELAALSTVPLSCPGVHFLAVLSSNPCLLTHSIDRITLLILILWS